MIALTQTTNTETFAFIAVHVFNPLSTNPTKWSHTLKTIRQQTADELFWVCLTILWNQRLKS